MGRGSAPASPAHARDCSVTVLFRVRCPECKSRKQKDGYVRHADHCILKEFRWHSIN